MMSIQFKPTHIIAATLIMVAGSTLVANSADRVLEIAHTAYTAGEQNIRTAFVALDISKNSIVTSYAQRMVDDHSAINEQANDILRKLNMALENNKRSIELVTYAQGIRAGLRKTSPKKFDCAYALSEMKDR